MVIGRGRPRYRRRRERWALLALLTILPVVFLTASALRLKSLLGELSVSRTNTIVNRAVGEAVDEAIQQGDIRYHGLVTFEKDDQGHIIALQSNMAEFNRLQTSIKTSVLERLEAVSDAPFTVHLGSLTGSAFLVGRGPQFTVRMQLVSSCSTRLENVFTHTGINQTIHSILLHVDVSAQILLPGLQTAAQVCNTFPVAETVIVGDVPGSVPYFRTGALEQG